MAQARLTFPKGFLWGTATAAHQVEGDNLHNDWHAWERQPGTILEAGSSGRACEWWQGRWREDLALAANSHQNAHRMSIEWARIEPEPGRWDRAALDQYRQIIQGMLEFGLLPVVCLHHFTNPSWLHERGGWLDERAVQDFSRYARFVVEGLADLVGFWVTINEPNVYAYAAYGAGAFPPGHAEFGSAVEALLMMARAHASAYEIIHEIQPHALVGVAHHYRSMQPMRPRHPLDRLIAGLRSSLFNHSLGHALQTGRFKLPWKTVMMPEIAGTQDYIGLNYYTREQVAFDIRRSGEIFGRSRYRDQAPVSPTGFIADEPDGFWEALEWAASFQLPVYVLENGVEDPGDSFRRNYTLKHLRTLWLAANFNWRIQGYFHWTLVDNFEWERGWTQSFGLWGLELETQARIKRPSADMYAEICRDNGFDSSLVARHAPEIMEHMFPDQPPGELA